MNQKELTDLLDKSSRLYYNGQQSSLTDTEFDLKLKELQKMEKESGVVYPNSPTIRVGSDLQDGFKKIKHPSYMLTIENAYDDDSIIKWVKSLKEKYGDIDFQASVKYDGVSCELHYAGGVLKTASTRGDKNIGDDITENVKTIKSVPLVLDKFFDEGDDFYVRGEILLPKSRLDTINKERDDAGDKPFSNTRNACSGTIKLLNPKEVAKRGLIFRAWDCFGTKNDTFDDMESKVSFLKDCGFFYDEGTEPIIIPSSVSSELIPAKVAHYKRTIDDIAPDYEYDGIVLKINSVELQKEIGTKDTRAIEWGIARKWNEEYIVKTTLIGVDWQVGRTGVLTPVGRLEPVECGGVVISNVTLNNIDFIEKFDMHIGDTLKITRSGGVIPYVIDIEHKPTYVNKAAMERWKNIGLSESIMGGLNESARKLFSHSVHKPENINEKIVAPNVCPECGALVERDGALLKCTDPFCPSVVKGRLLQFCSKDCMDIRSIGESVINDLYEKSLVKDVTDFYTLKDRGVDNLSNILGKGYGKKKIEKMLSEIENSKKQPWERVLSGLSIPGVGKVVARILASRYGATALISATREELSSIDGIGPIMASDIHSWFGLLANREILFKLDVSGLDMGTIIKEKESTGSSLNGLTVCFTGSSYRFSGDEAEAFLESNGAKCTHSVSKKLNYLIVGSKPGSSKVNKAKELGVEIIEEKEFYAKYGIDK